MINKKIVTWAALMLSMAMVFLVWSRRPPGRGSSHAESSDIKTLVDFDQANPATAQGIRVSFHGAVQAHLLGQFEEARDGYHSVLNSIPNEPITLHNLKKLLG